MTNLETRVAALEASSRRWRAFALSLVVLGGVAAAAAKPEPVDLLRARRLEIVNEQGRSVIVLTSTQGDGLAAVKTGDGANAIGLVANAQQGNSLSVYHAGGKQEAAVIEADNKGGVGIIERRSANGAVLP